MSEVERFSLDELSFKNSFAELKDLGGEIDLEDAVDDFLEVAEDTEAFLDEAVEDFLSAVEDFLLSGLVCPTPSFIIPRLMASSKAISFPVSGSVNTPVDSSMRPLFSASWNVIAPSPRSWLLEETLMVLLMVCVTVAVVTVMLSRLLRTAAPMGVIRFLVMATSRGRVDLVTGSMRRPDRGSMRLFMTACNKVNS